MPLDVGLASSADAVSFQDLPLICTAAVWRRAEPCPVRRRYAGAVVSAIRDGDAAALDRTWGAIKNQRLNDRQHDNTHDAGD